MHKTLIFLFLLFAPSLFAQEKGSPGTESKEKKDIPNEDFERPFNFFAAAGAAYRFGELDNVTVSPLDYTVQFEDVFPIHTRFSMGLVWNPFPNNSKNYKKEYFEKMSLFKEEGKLDKMAKAARKHVAVALLVNIAQLTFSSGDINTTTPIDVGFGLGYRSNNFLILGTLEFTPMRTPRKYFVDGYRDKDLPLILAGAEEPVRTISVDDDTLFTNKIFISIGIKVAYAFTKPKDQQ